MNLHEQPVPPALLPGPREIKVWHWQRRCLHQTLTLVRMGKCGIHHCLRRDHSGRKNRCIISSVLPETDGLTPISYVPVYPFTPPGRRYITESLVNPGCASLKKPGVTVRVPFSKMCESNDWGKLWNGPASSALRMSVLAE